MPAALWWNPEEGSDLLATTAENWQLSPVSGPYTPRASVAPTAGDYLNFDGGLTTADCTIPAATPGEVTTFAGISLKFGYAVSPSGPVVYPPDGSPPNYEPTTTYRAYSGTVTLAGTFDVNMLLVECGQVKQADPVTLQPPVPYAPKAGTLTVSGALYWTGGTLNSNSVAGTIALAPNAYGFAAPSFTNPGINGTVILGSTLELRGNEATQTGSSLQNLEGTYNLKNAANIVVHEYSSLLIKAPVPKPTHTDARIIYNADPVTHWAETKGLVENEGGHVVIESFDQPRTSNLPARVSFNGKTPKLLNKNGVVEIKDRSEVTFHPTEGEGTDGGLRHEGFDDPMTRIEAGSKVICEKDTGVRIDCGALELTALMNGEGQPEALQPDIVIWAPAAEYALDLPSSGEIRRSADRTVTLDLKVEGKFRAHGIIQFWADRTRGDSDTIWVSKGVVMDEFSKVDVQWFASTAASATAPTTWELVVVTSPDADDKIENEGLPRFEERFPAGDFVPTIALTAGDKKLIMERKP